jgi:hypothetical protein
MEMIAELLMLYLLMQIVKEMKDNRPSSKK